MIIGIENKEGKIYRVIETIGMGAYMHSVQSLLGLGFTDPLAESLHGENGLDSRMVPGDALISSPTLAELEDDLDPASELISSLNELAEIPETERIAILKSRVGQGIFRSRVIAHWGKCAVSGATCIPLLRASHIKPWRSSTNLERLDLFNGLLLVPNLDSAFDTGQITFDNQGRIVLSSVITGAAAYQLHINAKMRIDPKLLTTSHKSYLEYHQVHVYSDA